MCLSSTNAALNLGSCDGSTRAICPCKSSLHSINLGSLSREGSQLLRQAADLRRDILDLKISPPGQCRIAHLPSLFETSRHDKASLSNLSRNGRNSIQHVQGTIKLNQYVTIYLRVTQRTIGSNYTDDSSSRTVSGTGSDSGSGFDYCLPRAWGWSIRVSYRLFHTYTDLLE